MTNRKMAFISGIVVFISAIIFLGGILLLSAQNIFFSNKYIVYFKFSDVVGLRDRSPVYMRGYRIGWTKDVYFDLDSVRVRIDIKNKFKVPIDSKIEITTLNLIGEKAISITPGTSNTFLKPREIMTGENKDIMILTRKILLDLRDKIKEGELDDKIRQVGTAIDSFRLLVNNMTSTVKKIDIGMISRQIKNVGNAGSQLQEFLIAAQEDTRKFSDESSETMDHLNRTLDQIKKISLEVQTIAQKINNGQGSAAELLNNKKFIESINQTLLDLNEFLADIKKNPKKYVRFSIF